MPILITSQDRTAKFIFTIDISIIGIQNGSCKKPVLWFLCRLCFDAVSATKDERINMPRRLRNRERNGKSDKRTSRFRDSGFRLRFSQGFQIKEGQEINLVIDDIGSRGDGVSRLGDFLIFVPGSRVGERLRVKILRVENKFAIAERME